MLVTREKFSEVMKILNVPGIYAVDTETTGLSAYKGDSPFSIIITKNEKENFYFNLIPYPEWGEDQENKVLSKPHKDELRALFKSKYHLFLAHNAKFDMHMLARLDMYVTNIECTMIRGRILRNNLLSYSLANLTGEKDDTVKKYLSKNKLFTVMPSVFGNNEKVKSMHYDKVPPDLIIPYAEQDGLATINLYQEQEKRLSTMEEIRERDVPGTPSIKQALDLEKKVLKVVFNMEKRGIHVDRDYAIEAYQYEKDRAEKAMSEWKKITGIDYERRDSVLGPWFESQGIKVGRTKDNRYALDANALGAMGHEAARCVLEIRDAEKRCFTFWAGILERLDGQNRLHADFKQAGTATGRFSCSDPNLQNLPKRKDDDSKYPIRRGFIPPPGYCLYMPDYEQMEYRMFMDLAGQRDVIEEVVAGKDVHSATADLIGRERSVAKMVNFLLIYGGGPQKLADAINVPLVEAKAIRENYLRKLPNAKNLIWRLKQVAARRGWLLNWYGRPLRFDQGFDYKAPNHYIQGGCADVVKLSMVRCDAYLAKKKSYLVSQIHDELWFYIHESELAICEQLGDLMATAYPYRFLPMAVDHSHSWTSAYDKFPGLPEAKSEN